MKRNSWLLPVVAIVLAVLVIGGIFVMTTRTQSTPVDEPVEEEIQIKTITAEDIGLTLTARRDGKAITMTVTKLDGIKSIEYEVSYDAEVVEEGEKLTVPRGVTNSPVEVDSGDSEITREIELGTCSRNICKYDKIVSDVKFIIKVDYANGEVGSLEESVSL